MHTSEGIKAPFYVSPPVTGNYGGVVYNESMSKEAKDAICLAFVFFMFLMADVAFPMVLAIVMALMYLKEWDKE